MARHIITLALMLVPAGCVGTRIELDVGLGLTSVQRSQNAVEPWGEYTLVPADTSELVDEDGLRWFDFVAVAADMPEGVLEDALPFLLEFWSGYDIWAPVATAGFVYQDGLLSMAVVNLGPISSFRIENRTEESIRLLLAEAIHVGPTGLSTAVLTHTDMAEVPAVLMIPSHAVAVFWARADTIEEPYATCDDVPGTETRLVLPIEIQSVTHAYILRFEPQRADMVTMKDIWWDLSSVEVSRTPCGPTP